MAVRGTTGRHSVERGELEWIEDGRAVSLRSSTLGLAELVVIADGLVVRAAVSRHAWGVAVDLNFGQNPTGLSSVQDPRLLRIFARWGFTDGSRWLIPDAGLFEYLTPPEG